MCTRVGSGCCVGSAPRHDDMPGGTGEQLSLRLDVSARPANPTKAPAPDDAGLFESRVPEMGPG